MYYVLDRVLGETAVLISDDRLTVKIGMDLLPDGAVEGDCLLFENGIYVIDREETIRRTENIKARFHSLFKDEE